MTTLSCATPSNNPIFFGEDFGVSEGASEIRKETIKLRNHLARSVTFGEHLSKMMEGLFQVKNKSSSDNWDGYHAKAINSDAFQSAIKFALSLPLKVPMPEIYADPDGEITFEWYEDKRRVFSVSLGRRNKISYAGIYGYNKVFGVEYFYTNVPEAILTSINRLYSE